MTVNQGSRWMDPKAAKILSKPFKLIGSRHLPVFMGGENVVRLSLIQPGLWL